MPIPKLVVTLALMAAQTALTMTKKTEGPRLDELNVSVADYGTPLPRFWGIRRFECPVIWAEKLREKKKKSKTKGGKYTEYKYYGTWAIAVADNEIDTVSRIWLDRHIMYDTTGATPISMAAVVDQVTGSGDNFKLANGQNMRIYLGTEDQEPDPRITAWCEDRYGADTCPAYKGVAYIVFQDIPLEKFGNRIPQISVEAIHTKTAVYPYSQAYSNVVDTSGQQWMVSGNGLWMSRCAGTYPVTHVETWDLPSHTALSEGVVVSSALTGGSAMSIDDVGSTWVMRYADIPGTSLCLQENTASGAQNITLVTSGPSPSMPTYCLTTRAGLKVYTATQTDGYFEFAAHHPDPTAAIAFCVDNAGDAWALLTPVGSSSQFELRNLTDPLSGSHILTSPVTRPGPPSAGICYSTQFAHFFLLLDGHALTVDSATFTVVDHGAAPTSNYLQMPFNRPASASFWDNTSEYSLEDGSLIRTLSLGSWVPNESGLSGAVYDPVNHALITGVGTGGSPVTRLDWYYLDRVGSQGVTLQTVVDDVADWCGLSGHDSSTLTQTVEGYSVTQGSGKDMLAPLLDVHDVDPRPHDFQIQFVNRGSVAAGTISTSELARDGDENRYVASITQDTDLPRKITFNFADKDHDQQANNVIAQRPLDAVDAQREQSIDLGTYVATPEIAQKFADRYLRRQWIGRDKFSLALTAQRLALEPADVWNLELDGVTTTARLVKATLSGGKINTEWERDFPAITTLGTGTGGSMDGRDPETIYIPGPTKGFVKDIPLISDNDNNVNPLLYFGAGPYNSTQNWPGAYIMQSDPDGEDYDIEWSALDSSQGATWGHATDALDDANPNLWDRGNSVNVKGNLCLTSSTEAEIDTDPTLNLALLGDELLNFATATLESDGSYTLSGFKRGRRGTEWATADHAVGEDFVLAASLFNEGVGLSDVGVDEHFKVQTLGRAIDSAPAIEVDFDGRSLMPYAPARVKWTTDGTDLFGEIIRRTRVGGSWVGSSTIPLSENSEAYEVDVYHPTTFKRTISVSGTNLFTYTAAQMSADSNVVDSPPPILAYQMSDAVGRGFALAA